MMRLNAIVGGKKIFMILRVSGNRSPGVLRLAASIHWLVLQLEEEGVVLGEEGAVLAVSLEEEEGVVELAIHS